MKKVLIFSTAYLPLIGGAEIAVKEITDRLGDDFAFDLICARIKKEFPAQEKIGSINIHRTGRGGGKLDKFLLPWRGSKLANKLYQQEKYDAIWAIMASFGGLAALFFKNKYPRVPYLLTLQEGDPTEQIERRVGILKNWFYQIFRQADYIQAISVFLADWARKIGVQCPIEVVPNGVTLANYELKPITNMKEKLGIKENEKVIITASRLVEKNGIADLIKAMSSLPADVKLLILGSGPLENNLKLLALRSLGEGGEDKILFLGNISNDEVPRYLAVADVFVRPSLSEGLGNAFLEAMAAGVPIIGTRVGGIPDFLVDGETGLFCEVRDSQSIADKINILLSDEALRQSLIANGRKIVSEKYNWDGIAGRMKGIIGRLTI